MSETAIPDRRSDPVPEHDTTVIWADPQRHAAFMRWLGEVATGHGLDPASVRLASADASFRRYLRIDGAGETRIIMDAPPDKENCEPFVHVAQLMAAAGLRVPQVLAWDRNHGFLLLSDLGRQTMLQAIDRDHAQANLGLYLGAVDALVDWQRASRPGVLPDYDEALLQRELGLFPQWYLQQHRGVVPDTRMLDTLASTFAQIVRENLSWPSVYVHRDFMPRNLMMPPPGAGMAGAHPVLGVLDFQDAVFGPITYDIASLMRDAFLSWDEEFVLDVTIRYWEKARSADLPVGQDFGAFYRGVEWMGLQRHLKVAGIFARLTLRDGKPQYLADTPRFIQYIRATAARYRELRPLLRLVDQVEGIEERSGFAYGRM
ncbi:MAG: phosphotransferase [Rhodoferax sp.]|nr:phosphotransferase [Rhodoferax sp.]